jgi:hypothetical protein
VIVITNYLLSQRNGNFLLVERLSASEQRFCSLRLGCEYSKIPFVFFTGSIVVYVCVIQLDFLSLPKEAEL